MKNFSIKTKLNLFTITFFIFGIFYLFIIYFYFHKASQNVVNMGSNELMIKNTTNAIAKDFFLMNTIVFSNNFEKKKNQLLVLNENIKINITVIKQYAQKNNAELLKHIANIEIRYNSYYNMTQEIIKSKQNIGYEDKEELLIGLSQIIIKANDELEAINDFSDTLFRDSIYKIINNLETTFFWVIFIFCSSLLFLFVLNIFIKRGILKSIFELQVVSDYFVDLFSKENNFQRPNFKITQHNEVAKITKDMIRNIPLIEENIEKLKELGLIPFKIIYI